MGVQHGDDVVRLVRAGLCDQIDRIAAELPHMTLPRLCNSVDEIRRTAGAWRLRPVEQVAQAFGSALATHGRGATMLSWLETLREAADCPTPDVSSGETLAASVGVRLTH